MSIFNIPGNVIDTLLITSCCQIKKKHVYFFAKFVYTQEIPSYYNFRMKITLSTPYKTVYIAPNQQSACLHGT